MSSTSGSPTKDWLKNQLVAHGVPLPASSAKKEEYQRLYDEQVLPKRNDTEFSSDDDAEVDDTPTSNTFMSLDWIKSKGDKFVFICLKANGKLVGPVTDTTRELYQRMLSDLFLSDPKAVQENVEEFLAENDDLRNEWNEQGLNFNATTNGVSKSEDVGAAAATNGTDEGSENGYSDSDDESPQQLARIHAAEQRYDYEAEQANTRRKEEELQNPRLRSPQQPARIYAAEQRNDYEVEQANTRRKEEEPQNPRLRMSPQQLARIYAAEQRYDYEAEQANTRRMEEEPQNPRPIARAIQYLVLLIICIGGPLLAYYYLAEHMKGMGGENNVESVGEPEDELDVLLKTLEIQEENIQ